MKDKLCHDPAADNNLTRAHLPCKEGTIRWMGQVVKLIKAASVSELVQSFDIPWKCFLEKIEHDLQINMAHKKATGLLAP